MTMIWQDQLSKLVPTKLIKMITTPNGFWSQKNKTETDLVSLTEDPNPWLARTSSVMTTSLDSLPGSFTLPSNFSSELSKDIWLSKPATAKQTSPNLSKDLDGWLLVAPPISSAAEEPAASTSAKTCTNPLDEWERQSLTCNWIINDNNTTTLHIEEWLKKALEDEEEDETDDISDDFDDCSIEVISQNWNETSMKTATTIIIKNIFLDPRQQTACDEEQKNHLWILFKQFLETFYFFVFESETRISLLMSWTENDRGKKIEKS